MKDHIDAGDEVFFIGCNSNLKICELNLAHDEETCRRCIGRRNQGLSFFEDKITFVNLGSLFEDEWSLEFGKFISGFDLSSNESIKKIFYQNLDLGFGALSSIIDFNREPNPDLTELLPVMMKLFESEFFLYKSFLKFFKAQNIDRCYLFNGRFATHRPIFRAAESLSIDCVIHERGSSRDKYEVFHNKLPHDPEYFQQRIHHYWESSTESDEDKKNKAKRFFEIKRGAKENFWPSLITNQKSGLLPENWNPDYYNIAFFNSSEDEYAAIGLGYENSIYSSQHELLLSVLDSLVKNSAKNTMIYYRVHPALIGIDNSQIKEIFSVTSPLLTIIPADSPISSYALLDNCNLTLTFRSTMAIEATYWGKPSVVAAQAFYSGMNCAYEPKTHDELISLVLDRNLPAKPKDNVYRFAFFYSVYGIPFKHYQPIDLFSGKFLGKSLLPESEPGFETPILILCYAKPTGISEYFGLLQKLKPKKLYLAADDIADVYRMVDWLCEIQCFGREKNIDINKSEKNAIDRFFEVEEKGIILKENFIPDDSFFQFAEELLRKYRDDDRVSMITGTNLCYEDSNKRSDFYFSKIATTWGWATWRRSWIHLKDSISQDEREKIKGLISGLSIEKSPTEKLINGMLGAFDSNSNHWSDQWWATILLAGKFVIKPYVNLLSSGGTKSDIAGYPVSSLNGLSVGSVKFPLRRKVLVKNNILLDDFELRALFGESKPNLFSVYYHYILHRVLSFFK
ncbi:hypothetical protein [Leptospira sp. 'Mane']|uniref:capsular polysaccharide export protein, LipB/KpsS family n=1 Tax=Leptospira sp. 'Mane' TaxID=3387407 RepID=UPI00398AD8F2